MEKNNCRHVYLKLGDTQNKEWQKLGYNVRKMVIFLSR